MVCEYGHLLAGSATNRGNRTQRHLLSIKCSSLLIYYLATYLFQRSVAVSVTDCYQIDPGSNPTATIIFFHLENQVNIY